MKILEIAASQHGVVTRAQLRKAGVSLHSVEYWLKRGRLRALHRGVYRVGPVAGPLQREVAAVLACGDGAVLSHQTAAAIWGFGPSLGPRVPVDIVGPRSLRRRKGVRLRRATHIESDEVSRKDGLPVTTPARTLLDLASCVRGIALERAFARALRDRVVSLDGLGVMLVRYPRRRGGPALRGLVRAQGGPVLTRSEAEERFLDLLRKGGIRSPQVNSVVEGLEVDFLWRDQDLVVEIDGFAFHSGRRAFERDRLRDAELAAAGFRVVRVTWRHLTREPEATLVRLARALAVGTR